jgi:hypothetical protein
LRVQAKAEAGRSLSDTNAEDLGQGKRRKFRNELFEAEIPQCKRKRAGSSSDEYDETYDKAPEMTTAGEVAI